MENTTETELSVVTATVDVRIQDFTITKEVFSKSLFKTFQNSKIEFQANVSCAEENWLWVIVDANVDISGISFTVENLKWAVSIVDLEGTSKFTRYHTSGTEPYFSIRRDSGYLEKSFILERADEFLSDGGISVRCDFYVDFKFLKYLQSMDHDKFKIFIDSIPQVGRRKSTSETGNSTDTQTVFDLTAQVLTLPQFHVSRKKFGVYGISPVSLSELNSLEPKEDTIDILEHIWIFDTRSGRFLLSLAPIPDSVGHLLVNESPVIRRCVNAPMKEQREKRVELPEVEGFTFLIVLYFLESGSLKKFSNPLFEKIYPKVYQFSHMYEMENLRKKCARHMTRNCGEESEFRELEKMAELYEDEYLFLLLQKDQD